MKVSVMKKLMLEIQFYENDGDHGAEISINGVWFKEIGGLPTIVDVIKAIGDNEDIHETIKEYDTGTNQ